MASKEEIRCDVEQAIKSLDALDIFVLNYLFQSGEVLLTVGEVLELLGLTEEEFDQLCDRATKRLSDGLNQSNRSNPHRVQ